MREIIGEAGDIVEKKIITVKDYKRFREIGRQINDEEFLYFASYDERMFLRLPEIAEKEGHNNWLEPEDDD
jgi:hypothetical protein